MIVIRQKFYEKGVVYRVLRQGVKHAPAWVGVPEHKPMGALTDKEFDRYTRLRKKLHAQSIAKQKNLLTKASSRAQ